MSSGSSTITQSSNATVTAAAAASKPMPIGGERNHSVSDSAYSEEVDLFAPQLMPGLSASTPMGASSGPSHVLGGLLKEQPAVSKSSLSKLPYSNSVYFFESRFC